MPKPNVFIGSSVEGLNVAYAVQQNLLHDAEATVWDQGVFELSQTTIESLSKALANSDFAIFVFTADDLLRIRDTTSPAVRDNVLFEFGLFIGKLGRERVFFLLPLGEELHIPTDLLGVTPGKYESTRTDGSMQAATGAVCNQIRIQMKALGAVSGRLAAESSTESGNTDGQTKLSWISDFFDEKYQFAKDKLEISLKNESGDEALKTSTWILYCDIKLSKDGALDALINFANEHSDSSQIQSHIAAILRLEGHVTKAIQLLTAIKVLRPNDTVIALALANCHTEGENNANAITELQRVSPEDHPDVAINLAEALQKEERLEEALQVVQGCYAKHPSNQNLRIKYSRLAQDLERYEIAAYLLNCLTIDHPDSIEHWGNLGNICLQLDLYDIALNAYRKAEKLMKEDAGDQWIVANIGNLLTNKGLPSEACEYFERALKQEPRSEYTHERLAGALKKKSTEEKEFQKKCNEGKRQVHEASTNALVT